MTLNRKVGTAALLVLTASVAAGGGLMYYPEATVYNPPNTEANRQFANALRPGTTIRAWFTQDTFEQVLGFYRAVGREFKPPQPLPAEKLPSGQVIQKVFVIFDGAPDPVTSRRWIRIQHPFRGSVARTNGVLRYQDVRDVTEIVLTEWKPVPKQRGAKPQS
jgi:hypothetical protein